MEQLRERIALATEHLERHELALLHRPLGHELPPGRVGERRAGREQRCTALICSWMILHTRCTFAVRA